MVAFVSIINVFNVSCALVSILVSLLILKKDTKSWVNRTFFLTFFSWGLNVLFYSFVYLTELGSSLLNFIRDINVALGIIAAICLLFTGLIFAFGSYTALNKINIAIASVVTLVLIVVITVNDYVMVSNQESEIVTNTTASLTIFIIPGLLALFGIYHFYKSYRTFEDPLIRKRTLFFIAGASLLVLGALIFGVLPLLSTLQENLILNAIPAFLWCIGPISILIGLNVK